MNDKQKRAVEGLIVTISIIKHQQLTEDEQKKCSENMKTHFDILDKLNVSFNIQNQALFLGEKYDIRNHYLAWYIEKIEEKQAS